MISILLKIVKRLSRAIATFPDLGSQDVITCVSIYVLFTLIVGVTTGFLRWNPCKSGKLIVKITATSLIAPAILEELFFRAILLPYPSSQIAPKLYVTQSIISLCLFIVYHPLNGIFFFPQGRTTFSHPVFLVLATALGITCTLSYWQTGSLWLPVLIH